MTFPLTTFLLIGALGQTMFMLLMGAVALFLILLVLVQRGRGGGLAGALGGMGGSSAFGAKAGDVFTKITVVVATLWILLCIVGTKMTPSEESLLDTNVSTTTSTPAEDGPSLGAPAKSSEESSNEATAGEATAGETNTDDVPAETSETE